MHYIVIPSMYELHFPLLRGKSYICLSLFPNSVSSDKTHECLEYIGNSIHQHNYPIVNISALKAFENYSSDWLNSIVPFQKHIIVITCSLIYDASDNSFPFLLGLVSLAINMDILNAIQFENMIIPMLTEIWSSYPSYTNTTFELVNVAIKELAAITNFYPFLCSRMLNIFQKSITTAKRDMIVLTSSLELLSLLLEKGESPLNNYFTETLFVFICDLPYCTSSTSINQSIQQCLLQFIIKGADKISRSNKEGRSGVDCVLNYILSIVGDEDIMQTHDNTIIADIILQLARRLGGLFTVNIPRILSPLLVQMSKVHQSGLYKVTK
ncbi:armadillo-type protein [Pilobolus umbonatus]|nr:armadillo-type protein [Pilobolus umbonatus]